VHGLHTALVLATDPAMSRDERSLMRDVHRGAVLRTNRPQAHLSSPLHRLHDFLRGQ
jgi:hypothetical protein